MCLFIMKIFVYEYYLISCLISSRASYMEKLNFMNNSVSLISHRSDQPLYTIFNGRV